ncbi:hypothetical protein BD560DRAFT_431742 [Blakeslea trispora]|nr:hypothetical protein BD560DRAFT_431742 [Blakeslea trispora]
MVAQQAQPHSNCHNEPNSGKSKQMSQTMRSKRRSKSTSGCTSNAHQSYSTRRPSAPATVEAPRLSIANRFMSGDYSKNETASSGSISISTLHNKLSPASSILSAGYTGEPLGDTIPGRLTIAEAFMKSSSTLPNTTESCSASVVDDRTRLGRKESRNSRMSVFDDNFQLNLGASNEQGRKGSRPWGSQDTLVQMEKKKPIYAQYIESEKYATLNKDYSEDDKTAHSDYEDNKENIQDYNKFEKYYQHGPTGWEPTEDENTDSETEEKEQQTEEPSSTKTIKQAPEIEESRGIWIGCCLISCDRRPSPKKKEEDLEQQDIKRSKCCGRRIWVFLSFVLIIVCALVAYFLWPRTPLIRIEGASLTSPVKITETKQNTWFGGSIQFESGWMVNVTVDNRKNHIPTHLSQIQVLAKDALTGLVIGKGTQNDGSNVEQIVLPPNSISTIQLPIRIDYQARDNTDTTFGDLLKSCSPKQPSPSTNSTTNLNQREALALHFWITLHFFGLDWTGYKPTVIATPATGGFACPQS